MRLKHLLITLCMLPAAVALAQDADSTAFWKLRGEQWADSAAKNTIQEAKNGIFKPNKGYSLYFTKVDTVKVPYIVHVPPNYDPAKEYPLIVFLHGGVVSIDNFQQNTFIFSREHIFTIADKHDAIVLYPFGRKSFGWINQHEAFENIMNMITLAKKRYHINAYKVYLGGMSNGGTGTFWFITHHPDVFAGFYTFSALIQLNISHINFSNISCGKLLYSMHAVDDGAFPVEQVETVYNMHKTEAPDWHLEIVKEGGHGFIFTDEGQIKMEELFNKLLK